MDRLTWRFGLDLSDTDGGFDGRAACVSEVRAVYSSLCGVLQISQLGLVVPPREYTSGIHSLM